MIVTVKRQRLNGDNFEGAKSCNTPSYRIAQAASIINKVKLLTTKVLSLMADTSHMSRHLVCRNCQQSILPIEQLCFYEEGDQLHLTVQFQYFEIVE